MRTSHQCVLFPAWPTGIIVNISVTKRKASLASCNHPPHADSRNRRIGLDGLLILVFPRELDERHGKGVQGQTGRKASCGRTLVSTRSRINDHPRAYRRWGCGDPRARPTAPRLRVRGANEQAYRQRYLTKIVKLRGYRAACGHPRTLSPRGTGRAGVRSTGPSEPGRNGSGPAHWGPGTATCGTASRGSSC